MRDCEHCKHFKVKGCESWECNFEPIMTREKAIEVLKNTAFLATDRIAAEIDEAVKMAIDALGESVPCYIDHDGYVTVDLSVRKDEFHGRAIRFYQGRDTE